MGGQSLGTGVVVNLIAEAVIAFTLYQLFEFLMAGDLGRILSLRSISILNLVEGIEIVPVGVGHLDQEIVVVRRIRGRCQ